TAAGAVAALPDLLAHSSWRVSAEAIDGIKESSENLDALTKAAAYAKIVKLLNDPDGFVIARAVEALKDAKLSTAIEPMARAANAHPEIAGEVVAAMTSDEALSLAAMPSLREMCGASDARVRAAGLVG